jgi:ribonuclease HI
MGQKKRFYVVWKGKTPGVYPTWEACKAEIDGQEGAQYMAFDTKQEAELAYKSTYREIQKSRKKQERASLKAVGEPNYHSIAVDAASSGNPGVMEYRGVDTATRKVLFKQGPFPEGTNNIGEFLAIVHGLAYLKKNQSNRVIYTDSRTAISWVKKKKCNTRLKPSDKNSDLFELIHRAEAWLRSNSYITPVVKWETRVWGEIPADFGRK